MGLEGEGSVGEGREVGGKGEGSGDWAPPSTPSFMIIKNGGYFCRMSGHNELVPWTAYGWVIKLNINHIQLWLHDNNKWMPENRWVSLQCVTVVLLTFCWIVKRKEE